MKQEGFFVCLPGESHIGTASLTERTLSPTDFKTLELQGLWGLAQQLHIIKFVNPIAFILIK